MDREIQQISAQFHASWSNLTFVNIQPNHPQQRLLFFIAGTPTPEMVAAMEKAIHDLTQSRSWVIGPPEFVDETLPPQETGEQPVRTVGGFLSLYSALPPNQLPFETDKAHLAEVSGLMESLRGFSSATRCSIEFELDDVFVGVIESGDMDETLREGFIGEWRRTLEARNK